MKKMIALFLAAMMVMGVAFAVAEGVPSKTVDDVIDVLGYESTGETPKADFAIILDPKAPMAEAELNKILAFVQGGKAPKDYFGEGLLPADVDVLELMELVGITAENYDPAYGDVTAQIRFGTAYKAAQSVYPLVKLDAWQNAEGTAQDDGTVKITFTQDQLAALNGAQGLLTVLSTPAE